MSVFKGLIKSTAEKAIKRLPDNWTTDPESALRYLKKRVPEDEIRFSGLSDKLKEAPKVTKQDLLNILSNRQDAIDVHSKRKVYAQTIFTDSDVLQTEAKVPIDDTLPLHQRPDKVRAHFRTDSDTAIPVSHSRSKTVTTEDGKTEHYILEIQSDLFQKSYIAKETKQATPLRKNWVKKQLEKEMLNAATKGADEAILVINPSYRSSKLSDWYNTTVLGDLTKIANTKGFKVKRDTLVRFAAPQEIIEAIREKGVKLTKPEAASKFAYFKSEVTPQQEEFIESVPDFFLQFSREELAVARVKLPPNAAEYVEKQVITRSKPSITFGALLAENQPTIVKYWDSIKAASQAKSTSGDPIEMNEFVELMDSYNEFGELPKGKEWLRPFIDNMVNYINKLPFKQLEAVGAAQKSTIKEPVKNRMIEVPVNKNDIKTKMRFYKWAVTNDKEFAKKVAEAFPNRSLVSPALLKDLVTRYELDSSFKQFLDMYETKNYFNLSTDELAKRYKLVDKVKQPVVPDWAKDFTAYTVPAIATISASIPDDATAAPSIKDKGVYNALKAGYSIDEIKQHLITNKGASANEADDLIKQEIQNLITKKLQDGYDPAEVERVFEQQFGDSLSKDSFNFDVAASTYPEEFLPDYVPVAEDVKSAEYSSKQLAAMQDNLLTSYQELFNGLKAVYIDEDKENINKFNIQLKRQTIQIANVLRNYGRNIIEEDGDLFEVKENGEKVQVTGELFSDILYSTLASKGEVGLAIGGAIAAERLVAPITKTLPGKLLGVVLRGAAGITGSALGAATGRALDLAYNSYILNQELQASYYKKMMLDAGLFDAAIGLTVAGVGAVTAPLVIGAGKIVKAILDGNTSGAYKALKEFTDLTDEEIKEKIEEFTKLSSKPPKGLTLESKALEVIPQTQPNARSILTEADKHSPLGLAKLGHTIDRRSRDLISHIKEATTNNIGSIVLDDLQQYKTAVKEAYSATKQYALKNMPPDYQFNFDSLELAEVFKKANESIKNEAVQLRLQRYIDQIEAISTGRSFGNLLELYKTVNHFKYNTKVKQYVDYKTINNTLAQIKDEIKSASRQFDESGAWYEAWVKANTNYSELFKTERNVLYKALTRKGLSSDQLTSILTKYSSSLDETFLQVVSKLPVKTQHRVEGLLLDTLVNKHSFTTGELTGIDFVNLAKKLQPIAFTSPKARKLKKIINGFARVYKNDYELIKIADTLQAKRVSQGISDSLVQRLRHNTIGRIFSYLQSLPPTRNSRAIALGIKAAKAIQDPTDTKAVEALLKELPADSEISSAIHQLALVAAQPGAKVQRPYVQVYSSGTKGVKVIEGRLGRGRYYTTDKSGLESKIATTNSKIYEDKLLPTRIATEADIKQIVGDKEITPELIRNTPDLQMKLRKLGYDGLAIGYDVLMFP